MEDYEEDEIQKIWGELPDAITLLSICPNCQARLTGAPQFVCDRCQYPIDEFFISLTDIPKIVKSLSTSQSEGTELKFKVPSINATDKPCPRCNCNTKSKWHENWCPLSDKNKLNDGQGSSLN